MGDEIRKRRREVARLEPIAVDVEKALIGPVARGGEEDEKEDRAVDAGAIEEVGQEKEGDDESGLRLAFGLRFRASLRVLELTGVMHWWG